MEWVGLADVAEQLGVSQQRIRELLRRGRLDGQKISGRWLIDPASLPAVSRRVGQPLSPRVAWALADIASGGHAPSLSAAERSRARAKLRHLLDSDDPVPTLASLMARRASRSRWSAPDPAGLLDDGRIVPSGVSDPRSGMSSAHRMEGYVNADDFDDVIGDHLLVRARGPENVVLHHADVTAADLEGLPSPLPWLVIAADLAESGVRETQQAMQVLRAGAGDE